jgi:tetratricopeptide (TPR) repeat protein
VKRDEKDSPPLDSKLLLSLSENREIRDIAERNLALHLGRLHGRPVDGVHSTADSGFPLVIAFGEALLGCLLIEQGQRKEGIAQLSRVLAGFKDIRGYRMTLLLSLFAEACLRQGQIEQGLQAVAHALPMCKKYAYEPEVLRLKGELLLRSRTQGLESGAQKEAEECFLQAIEISSRQTAKWLELRAAISLSRLWQRQGKRAEARQMLAEIYGWFTEGFDTADLKEAKELLKGLSQTES